MKTRNMGVVCDTDQQCEWIWTEDMDKSVSERLRGAQTAPLKACAD